MVKRITTLSAAVLSLFACLTGTSHAQSKLAWDYPEQSRTHNTDLKHIEFHIAFDQPHKEILGTVLTTLEGLPNPEPFREFVFDAMDMTIDKVWLDNGKGKQTKLQFDTTESNKLRISLDKAYPFNTPLVIGIQYHGYPKKGMYFIQPDSTNPNKPWQIWTQGEGEDNRHWYPTYDYPNDKTTTDMFVTVRGDQQALSNGKLIGKEKNKDGTVTWHYNESKPYSTYLVMLGIGEYKVVEETWHGKPVQYWVYPGWENDAKRIFGLTPKMLDFFSTKTGFEYGWEKYAQIAIADFMYGGMENVGATTLNDYVLFDKKTGVDFSSEGLIAHELAHQWFGDVITCRSWIHMWLNESFATYFEAMFRENQDGKDEFDEEMQGNQNAALGAEATLGKKPIVAANNYSANHYPRGASVLNMMRHILGDDAWWASIHHYLDKHQYQNAITEDLKISIEEATGQNLQWFFEQWLLKDGHPVFDVNYDYDNNAKVVRLQVTQLQPRDSMTGTFKMPIDIELTMPNGSKRLETIRVQDSSQNFSIVSPEKPVMVIFDKGNTTLKELHFHKTDEELRYQIVNAPLAIERSQAAQMLGATRAFATEQNRAALASAIRSEKFWATRMYELTSLGFLADSALPMHKDLVVDLALHDPRPDVRLAALEMTPRLKDHDVILNVARQALANDSSYRVHLSALRIIARFDPEAGYTEAVKALNYSSPRDRVKQGALDVLAQTRLDRSLTQIINFMSAKDVMKSTRYSTIDAIAAMRDVDSARVYNTLWAITENGDPSIASTAMNKLADFGDASVLARFEQLEAQHPDKKELYEPYITRMRNRLNKHS